MASCLSLLLIVVFATLSPLVAGDPNGIFCFTGTPTKNNSEFKLPTKSQCDGAQKWCKTIINNDGKQEGCSADPTGVDGYNTDSHCGNSDCYCENNLDAHPQINHCNNKLRQCYVQDGQIWVKKECQPNEPLCMFQGHEAGDKTNEAKGCVALDNDVVTSTSPPPAADNKGCGVSGGLNTCFCTTELCKPDGVMQPTVPTTSTTDAHKPQITSGKLNTNTSGGPLNTDPSGGPLKTKPSAGPLNTDPSVGPLNTDPSGSPKDDNASGKVESSALLIVISCVVVNFLML